MIGWNIYITRQKPVRRWLPATAKTKAGNCIASWSAHCSGLEWIEKLMDEKKVIRIRKGFYPGLYTGKAKDILAAIQQMPPYVKEKHKWIEDEQTGEQILCSDGYYFGKSEQEIVCCNKREWLHIEIWDMS